MDAFRVIEPGPMTTIQDLGRLGYQEFGVPISGALDTFSTRIANLLVGNPEEAAVLEITFMGPKLEALAEALVAVTGADIPVLLNDKPVESWSAFAVKPGDVLALRQARAGLRAYLAVGGGIDVPRFMGSRSTFAGARLGGVEGRALARGDLIARGSGDPGRAALSLPTEFRPELASRNDLRAVPGPQDDYFDAGIEVFFGSEFKVTTQINRMGYRLAGPKVDLKADVPRSIISEPSLAGAVQVPPDGQPIILLVEQTVGGYAKIATVITPDLPKVAQARPDDVVRFLRVDLETAHRAFRDVETRLDEIRRCLRGA
jgi:biotin-dependent carboxylase-like uncharacterized protein